MKKLLSLTGLIVFLFALSLVSCKKDKTPEELLTGKWEMVTEHWIDYENDVKVDEGTDTYVANELVIEIFSGGTGKSYEDGTFADNFTWSISGDVISITISGLGTREGSFTVDESKLTLDVSWEETYNGIVYKTLFSEIFKRI